MPRSDGQTTLPVESTQGALSREQGLALRWVFPDHTRPPTVLSTARIVLGRGENCDASLPGTEISREHAEIRRDGPLFILRDLQSRNGVFVRGVRLNEAPLEAGDVLRLGEWVGVVVPAGSVGPGRAFRRIAGRLLGGPVLADALELGLRAAKSDLPILIEGETGTGKELTAQALHELSGRKGPFVGVNCAALPEALAEGELFGYRRGAFTGAERASIGFFRAAQHGTLLLDELTDLPLSLQAKLLRVLEEHQVVPLGESTPVALDVRVIAATQQPLSEAVSEKRFRADLLARLHGLTIALPPLRQRREDVGYVVQELLREHSGGHSPELDARFVEALCTHDWPFNVRELDLLVRRVLVLHGHEAVLKRTHLPAALRGESAARSRPAEGVDRDEHELSQLVACLRKHKGNVARAAADVGISRQRAYRLMESRGDVDLDAFRGAPPANRGTSS
jgi:transcriptional regulator with AAA-type ATPase domain